MKTRKLKSLLVAALFATGLYATADVPGDTKDFQGCRKTLVNGDICNAVAGWTVYGCVNNEYYTCYDVPIIEEVNP
jgi:hypothetical protein